MIYKELKLMSWFAYAAILALVSMTKLQPSMFSAPVEVVATLITQSFEFILLLGLVLAIANIQRGKQWFWKVINGLLGLGILSLLFGALLIAWQASFIASLSLITGVLVLLPMQYKLFQFAYAQWPVKQTATQKNLECCSNKV